MNSNKLNTLSKSILVAGILSVVTLPAAAQNHRNNGYKNNHNNNGHHQANHSQVSYDYAKVVNVQPSYETYQVNNPVEQCYQEQVPVNDRASYRKGNGSYTNEIIGGVIGAAVGNQVGKSGGGKARDVVTVIGGVLGASVAHDIERRNTRRNGSNDRYQQNRYKTVEHCEIKDSYTTERKVVGYDVAYQYNGKTFHTQSNQHPGKRIRVQVLVKPA